MSDLNDFLREKLRVPTMTANDAPDGGDRELADAAGALADEAGDVPYTPPLPVPISRPDELRDEATRRGPQSEVWLINPPATLPGLGSLVGGGTSEKGSQFSVNSIRVDNLTSQWMYFPEIGAWCPPFWFGRVFRADGGKIQRVRFETPGGITAFTVSTSQVARVVFSNDYWAEVDGESAISNLGGGTTGAQAFTFVVDNADAVAVQTTAVDLLTMSRLSGFNGTTYDRLRAPAATASGATMASNLGILAVQLAGSNGANFVPAQAGNSTADANASALTGLQTIGNSFLYNGASWDRARVPKVFKQVATSAIGAGSTVTVWTPAAGLKPRLMGWVVTGSSGLVDAAVTFFETSTTGTFMGETGFLAGVQSPSYVSFGPGGPIVSTSSAVIVAFSSTGLTLRGTLFGTEE